MYVLHEVYGLYEVCKVRVSRVYNRRKERR